jgi:hypothetical protein
MELQLFDESKFNQAVKLAATLAKSTIVPKHFQGHAEDVFACLVLGAELGFQPMQALNSIVMIQGNATLKAQTMLALVRSKCKDSVIEITSEVINGEVHVSCFAKRDQRDPGYKATWSKKKAVDAKFAISWDKDLKKWVEKHNWIVQPETMSRWRAIAEALRVIFPDVLMGIYSTEEMEDLPPIVDRNDPAGQLLTELRNAPELDFPIPPEEKAVGPLYRFQNSVFRGKQLWQVPTIELEEYLEKLNKRTTPKKSWELELQSVLSQYLANFDQYKEMILELEANENE